ncbi:phage tail protein [Escherichia coli]|uniref:phage tail protein n=1 Tax=Escherichia coli TaxID=562 RepID=UPI0026B6C68C
MDAFGCTSRGQAHRAGLWLIKTELLETQTVDFSVGAEGLRHVPGMSLKSAMMTMPVSARRARAGGEQPDPDADARP